MGMPVEKGDLGNIVHELVSAMSALNMYPTETPDEENKFLQDGKPKEELYISEKFEMATHSYAHIRAAARSVELFREEARQRLIEGLRELKSEGVVKYDCPDKVLASILLDVAIT